MVSKVLNVRFIVTLVTGAGCLFIVLASVGQSMLSLIKSVF